MRIRLSLLDQEAGWDERGLSRNLFQLASLFGLERNGTFTRPLRSIIGSYFGRETSGLSLRHRYHAGIRLRTSEYFHWKGLAVF